MLHSVVDHFFRIYILEFGPPLILLLYGIHLRAFALWLAEEDCDAGGGTGRRRPHYTMMETTKSLPIKLSNFTQKPTYNNTGRPLSLLLLLWELLLFLLFTPSVRNYGL